MNDYEELKELETRATMRNMSCPICDKPIAMNDEECPHCKTSFHFIETPIPEEKSIFDKVITFLTPDKVDEKIEFKSGSTNSDKLLDYNALNSTYRIKKQSYIGIKPIAISDIVGSLGRYNDFNQHFLPVDGFTTTKLEPIIEAWEAGKELPPIDVYLVNQKYFIVDGHHRVSAARLMEKEYLDANITQIEFETPLNSEGNVQPDSESLKNFIIELEKKTFQMKTYLYNDMLSHPIIVTNIASYGKLFDDIITQFQYSREISKEANLVATAFEWYRHKYLPVIRLITNSGLLAQCPNRTATDFYVWLLMHRYFLSKATKRDVGYKTTIQDFMKLKGKKEFLEKIPNHYQAYIDYIQEHSREIK